MKFFDSVLLTQPKHNVFDLSHEVKLTCNMGELVPILLQEIVPGDKVIYGANSEILTRFMPMLAPVMHRIDIFTHYFYVSNRIIDQYWEEFITGEDIGGLQNLMPKLQIDSDTGLYFVKGRLPDYFGVPPTVDDTGTETQAIQINAHPFLAYAAIYNEYYRDENLVTEIDIPALVDAILADPSDLNAVNALTTLRIRAWEKDYFTSALPWAQKGTAVPLPIGVSAPVIWANNAAGTNQFVRDDSGAQIDPNLLTPNLNYIKTGVGQNQLTDSDSGGDKRFLDLGESHIADLSNATGVTLNDLRRAEAIQKWMEKNARGGNRYIETLLVHFGIKSSDARLHKPEYLGGGKNPVVISEVLSTDGANTGEMAGHGVSIGRSNSFGGKYFEENGWLIGIMSILPRTQYTQGLNKHWLHESKEDYYWPSFAQLGEQEVDIKELYVNYYGANSTTPFGYQSRYAELKHGQSRVAGEFRDTLEFWGCHRIFGSAPTLNQAFIECNEDAIQRIFAIQDPDEDKIVVQCINNLKMARQIPYYNIPTL